jgi:predicted metal-dependent hydrolase
VALYNHRQFFECHEVLEQAWLQAEGRPKDFYKGLIQAAVAFHHWSRGNLPGAMSLYRSSSRYLRKYLPAFLGIDVAGFFSSYTELFGWLRRHSTRYDPRLVPPIRWIVTDI